MVVSRLTVMAFAGAVAAIAAMIAVQLLVLAVQMMLAGQWRVILDTRRLQAVMPLLLPFLLPTAAQPARVAEMPPHVPLTELVLDHLGDRYAENDHQHDGHRAAQDDPALVRRSDGSTQGIESS